MKQRNYNLDKIRFISALMVVLIHSTTYISYEGMATFKNYYFYRDFLNYAVLIFFASAGVLFSNSNNRYVYSKKYSHNMLLLFLSSSLFYILYKSYNSSLVVVLSNISMRTLIEGTWGSYHLWYLWTMYLVSLLDGLIHKHVDDELSFVFWMLLFFLYSTNSISLNEVIVGTYGGVLKGLAFFYLGIMSSRINLNRKINIVLGVVFFSIYYYFTVAKGLFIGDVAQSFSLFFLMSYVCSNPGKASTLSKMNNYGADIYIYHVMAIDLVRWSTGLLTSNLHNFPITVIAGTMLTLVISVTVGKLVRYFKKIINNKLNSSMQ